MVELYWTATISKYFNVGCVTLPSSCTTTTTTDTTTAATTTAATIIVIK
jgi:hypothetical protein